jgi:hypothetical protein
LFLFLFYVFAHSGCARGEHFVRVAKAGAATVPAALLTDEETSAGIEVNRTCFARRPKEKVRVNWARSKGF